MCISKAVYPLLDIKISKFITARLRQNMAIHQVFAQGLSCTKAIVEASAHAGAAKTSK